MSEPWTVSLFKTGESHAPLAQLSATGEAERARLDAEAEKLFASFATELLETSFFVWTFFPGIESLKETPDRRIADAAPNPVAIVREWTTRPQQHGALLPIAVPAVVFV